jgi:hypothetical protein
VANLVRDRWCAWRSAVVQRTNLSMCRATGHWTETRFAIHCI